MFFDALLMTILGICVITDLKSRKIYNKVIFPSLAIAFLAHLYNGGIAALGASFSGFCLGLGVLLIPYLLGGMGAGDVKLLALIGALKGSSFVLETAIYMALIGGIIALIILLCRPGIGGRLKALFYFCYGLRYGLKIPLGIHQSTLKTTYPYGVAIAGGAVLVLIGEGWVSL